MDSALNSTKAETNQEEHSVPSFLIGIIVISVFVGLVLLVLIYLLVRRMQAKKNEIETSGTQAFDTISPSLMITTLTKNEMHPTSVAPVTSSLDTNDIFFSIIEHPPPVVRNNAGHFSPAIFEEGYCLNSTFTDTNSLYSDPISASLARQREDRRMSCYIAPSLSQTKLNDEKQIMRRLSVSSYQVW